MGQSRVHIPAVERLYLSAGDYVDVKNDLNAGEYFDLLTALSERRKFAKLLAYLLDWSFVALDGVTPIPFDPDDPENVRRDTIGALKKGTLRELVAAVDRHEAAQEAQIKKDEAAAAAADKEARKQARFPSTAPAPATEPGPSMSMPPPSPLSAGKPVSSPI